MLTWGEFSAQEPDLAEAGRSLFYVFGVGLAYLATTRKDGAPRVHPVCVVQTGAGLFGLIVPSYKLADLRRDGRYALHSYPLPQNEDAFNLSGRAEERTGQAQRDTVIDAFIHEVGRQGPPIDASQFQAQTLVEFLIGSCLLTRTTGHGDPDPQHRIWKAG